MSSSISKAVMTLGTVAGCLMATAGQAGAFTFGTNWSGAPPKGDIYLESVKIGSTIVSDFALVNRVNIIHNDLYTGGNTGAASSDLGDKATAGIKLEGATNASVEASLGNRYLSSIIDTEDRGSFSMDLFFDKGVDTLLFWERGINSSLDVMINGITKTLTKSHFAQGLTNFKLDTTEISGAQNVGSYGVSLSEFGISGKYTGPVRLSAHGSRSNGPDFKVVGAAVAVPEPATLLGLAAIASSLVVSRRRKSVESA